MRASNRGFTLVEALFSFVLVAMVLGALNHTLIQAAKVKQNTAAMDQAIEEFHALLTIKNDMQAAIIVQSPSSNQSTSDLIISRVDPRKSFVDRVGVIGDSDDPFEPAEQVRVSYRIENDVLKRFVNRGGAEKAQRLISAESLRVERSSGNPCTLTATIRIRGPRVTKSRTIKAALRGL